MTELGNILRENREAKGISLDELQSITKIQKRYLLGIEEGNYSMMPGKFYVRAFIKQYAEAVGLNPDQLVEQYKSEIPVTYNEELPEQLSRVQTRKGMSAETSKIVELLPKILIGAVIIAVIALIWYFFVQSAGDDSNEPATTGKNQTTVEEPKVEEDEETDLDEKPADEKPVEEEPVETPEQNLTVVSSSGGNTIYELKNTDKFIVKVVSLGETWVGVKNGSGKTVFQATLIKGKNESQSADLTNDTKAVLNVGRAPDTEIYVNDQKLEYAVPPGEVTTQVITINFIK